MSAVPPFFFLNLELGEFWVEVRKIKIREGGVIKSKCSAFL